MNSIIAGILSARSIATPVPVSYEYFTTVLYPFADTDTITVNIAVPQSGVLWESPNDVVSVSVPILPSGTLIPTIVYKTYNEPIAVESISANVATLQSGILTQVINYISYTTDDEEQLAVSVATLQNGTLT